MDRPTLTLVLPARNEAAVIRETLSRVSAYLDQLEPRHEILVGDSGSTDGTGALALDAGVPNVRVIRVETPGKGRILTRCLAEARGEVVGFLDADLEIPVDTVGRLLERIHAGADVGIAVKTPRHDGGRPVRRRIGTRVFNTLVGRLFASRLTDHQAGCKLFRAQSLLPHLHLQASTGWLWDTEILIRLLRAGARVDEVPCEPRPSRPSRLRRRDMVAALAQLGALYLRLRSGRHPAIPAPSGVTRPGARRIHA